MQAQAQPWPGRAWRARFGTRAWRACSSLLASAPRALTVPLGVEAFAPRSPGREQASKLGPVLPPSKRSDVSPFIVMDVMRDAAERETTGGEAVLHLEVGQPSTPAPRAVREAAQRALAESTLGYTVATGPAELRASIARHYQTEHEVAVDKERIVITSGASGAFLIGFLAAFDEGDRVALASPGYPCYRNILRALGIVPVEI